LLLAAERYNRAEPVNLGTGEEISIRELAQMIATEVNFTGQIIWDTTKPNGQPRRCLDVSRAKSLFDFQGQHRLCDGIPKTIASFMEHHHILTTSGSGLF